MGERKEEAEVRKTRTKTTGFSLALVVSAVPVVSPDKDIERLLHGYTGLQLGRRI